MSFIKKMWKKIKGFFSKEKKVKTVVTPTLPTEIMTPPVVRDSTWFWSQPFNDQLKYVESGEWIQNGLSDFFAMQWDNTVPAETRRRIAKAYSFRYGMPYSDPTVENRVPTGLGMGTDGNQK